MFKKRFTKKQAPQVEALPPPEPGVSRRRFERVSLTADWGQARALLGARVSWPNMETSDIFDISYIGMALGRPALFELSKDQRITIQIELAGLEPFTTALRTVWFNDKVVGTEFVGLDIDARSRIDDFLEDRLIGLHMRRIDPKYFRKDEDFDEWYHGPKDTDVFLWLNSRGAGVKRAVVEIDGQILIYENRQIQGGGRREFRLTDRMAVESDPDVGGDEPELTVVLDREAPVVKRVREILSQIGEQRESLKALIEALAKVKN